MSTAKLQNIAGSKKFFRIQGNLLSFEGQSNSILSENAKCLLQLVVTVEFFGTNMQKYSTI